MKPRINWGTGVALAYVIFAASTCGFVAFALGRQVDLVAPDYYARSLQQDRQMAAARRADELGAAVSATLAPDGAAVLVALPASHAATARGSVTLYRASDASADRAVDLKVGESGHQVVPLDGLPRGLWSVRVRWTAQGREFYLERRLVAK